MDNRTAPPCQGIVDLDRENLCVVDGVVFEKEGYRQYIREEHRPRPKPPIETGAQTADTDPHPSSGICSVSSQPMTSLPSSAPHFAGSMPCSADFAAVSSAFSSGSAFCMGGYGIDLI